MASMTVRNPIVGFVLALLISLALSAVVGYAAVYIPYLEFQLFFLGFSLFGIGALAGRRLFLGSLGFVSTYLGAFLGFYLSETLFWVRPFLGAETLALVMALTAGAGGFLMGRVGIVRLSRVRHFPSSLRRCSSCGARVGLSAHKCWSCKATLTY